MSGYTKTISIIEGGEEHTATLIVTGVRKLYATAVFRGEEFTDSFPYRPDQKGYLEIIAHQLLREKVTGRMLCSRPVKPRY